MYMSNNKRELFVRNMVQTIGDMITGTYMLEIDGCCDDKEISDTRNALRYAYEHMIDIASNQSITLQLEDIDTIDMRELECSMRGDDTVTTTEAQRIAQQNYTKRYGITGLSSNANFCNV